ncbi:MAG: hypothetical protein F6K31_11690 [Symploca sp. SIO2G7]|nr:hypothetical protein [Symploca sp. SIO2G7]
MKDTDLREQLSAIARQFKVFECVLCAEALRQFLISQNRSGWQISLFTGSTEDPFCNVYHEDLQQNISVNGRHEAIAIMIEGQKVVFDNLNPEGLPRASWIESFYCPIQDLGGNFEITESEF